ncbi:MAG: Uncharacterized protein XD58_1589 [Thermotoga sp. 50_1627]|uniref:tripartite tricarboxylate transporter substrate binding protein n=1 Tax=Pseudothermotoga sp. TaxID=2033661 RepID=UPI00076CE5B8|nr:MAG: Uncharacterized protein XD45_1653 [Thermotoga sp. 50_64]KUK24412.1 MAG: Uncharacterized protein XD58_1589 [Thermotoga sp. 50_1627]MBC7116952.1 tripartite tricarboxylate transporter substrate binding protein [Pseudothermotoga sp.]MDK2923554.1 hypothetical protein [Pseudothermotoga sp.]HBT40450.1 C4-dicarboxylate ABC transporter substrate-binding protein [Pseudothermotoga sp.]
MKVRVLVVLFALLALTFVLAEKYPSKPITYVICFAPGGESDITARLQQPYLEKILGVPIVITYKEGGGGAVGWTELVTRAKPDGYTIYGTNLPHTILQPLQGGVGYKTEQINNIYFFQSTPCVLAVRIDSPINTFEDFVKYAKEKGVVTLGGSGQPSANSFATVRLAKLTGLNIVYVPFSGSGTAVPALLGGHVDGLMTYTTMAVQYRDKMKVIAVASEKRLPWFPDVPTFRELGIDLVEKAYRGVAVPPGTPEDVKRVLEAAVKEVNNNPEFVAKMEEMGFVIENYDEAASAKLVSELMAYYKELWEETKGK